DVHEVRGAVTTRPGDVDGPVRLLFAQLYRIRARLVVHGDPRAAGDEADDRISRHGSAALGELDPQIGVPVDDHALIRLGGMPLDASGMRSHAGGEGDLGALLLRAVGAAEGGAQPL